MIEVKLNSIYQSAGNMHDTWSNENLPRKTIYVWMEIWGVNRKTSGWASFHFWTLAEGIHTCTQGRIQWWVWRGSSSSYRWESGELTPPSAQSFLCTMLKSKYEQWRETKNHWQNKRRINYANIKSYHVQIQILSWSHLRPFIRPPENDGGTRQNSTSK